jgi:predicted MFS family arabinose efflux permease
MPVSVGTLQLTSTKLLFTAGLFQFVTYACFFNLTPLYPEVGRDLALDAGALGTLIGVGGIVAVLVQIPAGTSGDRWGRRPFFALALVLLMASQLTRWLAQTPATLLMAQVLGGAAQGTATVNAWATVADYTAGRQGRGQGQAFGILNASLAVGLVAGYLLAGALGSLLGWREMSLLLVVLPVLALPALAWVPGGHADSQRPGLKAVLASLAHRQRLALAAMAALTLGAGQGSLYLLPFGVQQRDLGAFAAALLLVPYVVGSVIAGPVGGRLIERLGMRPVLIWLLLVGSLAIAALVWGAGSEVAIVVCFTLIGAAVNGALPLLAVKAVALGESAGVGAGSIIAGLRMGQSSGTFLGPAVAGLMLAHAGLNTAWLAQAGCLLLSLAIYEVAAHERQTFAQPAAASRT